MLPPLPRCSRWAHSSLENYPSVSAFPDSTFGSACTSTFSRIARRSLALRPAHSHGHQIRDRYPRASDISSPPCLPRLLPAGAVAGRGLHPLENAALSRRTWIPVLRRDHRQRRGRAGSSRSHDRDLNSGATRNGHPPKRQRSGLTVTRVEDHGEAAASGHVVSPAAKRRPDRKSSRSSGLRYRVPGSITAGVIARSRLTISRASSSRPICAQQAARTR